VQIDPGQPGGPTVQTFGTGGLQIKPTAASLLPTCSSITEGIMWPVTDASTNTWGATIVGGGTNHVLVYCDGSGWTVAAK
jgi:hypothetical protein